MDRGGLGASHVRTAQVRPVARPTNSLSIRRDPCIRMLARRPDGIFVAPFEQGEIGPDLFRHTLRWGWRGSSRNAVIGKE